MVRGPGRSLLGGGGDGQTYLQKLLAIDSANLIALWPLSETSGTNADDKSLEGNDGTYTGVTLAATTFKNGDPAPQFDGANDFLDIYSAGFNADFNPAEFTLALWVKFASLSVWTDSTARHLAILRADASNRIFMQRTAVDNTIDISYRAGGTINNVSFTDAGGNTDWFHLAVTVSATADELKAYYNFAQIGATQTTLDTWVGALNSTRTLLGAGTQGGSVLDGYMAYAALWKTPLTAEQIAQMAV